MLFKTADEIRTYLPQNASFEFEQIAPFIKQAGEQLILANLGDTLYDALVNAYGDNNLDDAMEALLDKVRHPLANYAYYKYIPVSQVAISASGIHISVSDTRKTAFEWQVNKLEQSFLEAAQNGVEQLLLWLEKNKTTYADWTGSDAYTEFKECFVNTASEFSRYFNIGNSRLTFVALKSLLLRMEEFHIKPMLGATLFNTLKAGLAADDLTDANKALVGYIKPAVVCFTAARAIVELPLKFTNDGIHILIEQSNNTVKAKVGASERALAALELQAQKDAERYIKILEDYLYANAADFEDWMDEGSYVTPATEAEHKFDQSGNGVVGF